MKKKFYTIILILVMTPTMVFAHPGRTDANGCHTCKTNCEKWGGKLW